MYFFIYSLDTHINKSSSNSSVTLFKAALQSILGSMITCDAGHQQMDMTPERLELLKRRQICLLKIQFQWNCETYSKIPTALHNMIDHPAAQQSSFFHFPCQLLGVACVCMTLPHTKSAPNNSTRSLVRFDRMAWDEKNRDEWAKRYLEFLGEGQDWVGSDPLCAQSASSPMPWCINLGMKNSEEKH